MPGQVELFSNHDSLKNIIKMLEVKANLRMVTVNMVDVTHLYDRHRFLSAMTLSLTSLIGLETPFLNFITKVDLMSKFGPPDLGLPFYQGTTTGLRYMFFHEIENGKDENKEEPVSKMDKKFGKLTGAMCEMLENYS